MDVAWQAQATSIAGGPKAGLILTGVGRRFRFCSGRRRRGALRRPSPGTVRWARARPSGDRRWVPLVRGVPVWVPGTRFFEASTIGGWIVMRLAPPRRLLADVGNAGQASHARLKAIAASLAGLTAGLAQVEWDVAFRPAITGVSRAAAVSDIPACGAQVGVRCTDQTGITHCSGTTSRPAFPQAMHRLSPALQYEPAPHELPGQQTSPLLPQPQRRSVV